MEAPGISEGEFMEALSDYEKALDAGFEKLRNQAGASVTSDAQSEIDAL
jgi:hypothetical protein